MTETKELTLADVDAGQRPWEFPVRRERLKAGGVEHDRFAIIRNVWDPIEARQRDIVIGDVGEHYDVVTFHQMMLPVFAQLREAHPAEQIRIKYTEQNFGERGHFRITFGDDIDFGEVVQPGKHVFPTAEILRRAVDFSTGYTSGYGLRGVGLFEQLRCFNGLIIPQAAFSFSMRHTGWDDVAYGAKVDRLLDSILAKHNAALEKIGSWRQMPLTPRDIAHVLDKMEAQKYPAGFLNNAARTMLHVCADDNPTAWMLFSELTNHRNIELLDSVFHQQRWNGKTFELIDEMTQEAC